MPPAPPDATQRRLARGPLHRLEHVGLVLCSLLLVFAGVMIVDLVAHQATYESTHDVGSPLLDTILGWFEK